MNYYRILQISENATNLEVEQAYDKLLTKWLQIRIKSSVIPRERIDIIIRSIEDAYKVISSPEKREEYDKASNRNNVENELPEQVKINTPPPSLSEDENITKKSNYLLILLIVLILMCIAYGLYYFIFNNTSQNTEIIQSTQPNQDEKSITKEALENAKELIENKIQVPEPNVPAIKKAPVAEPQLKNIDELTDMAKKIAQSADKYRNSFINKNTTLLGASASKQNIRLNFKVIEGIADSPTLLETYFNERFAYDNNVCKTQEKDIKRGNAFIFAYYDNSYKLLTIYMIDQDVCDSPLERRIIKKVDDDADEPQQIP